MKNYNSHNGTEIVFATTNEGKMKEVRMLLKGLECEIKSLRDLGIDISIVEDGATFEENALIKARTISGLTKGIVLADDSGLEVDYLDKAPGVLSARFLGEDTPYAVKNRAILDRLAQAASGERSARFVCAIACVLPDGESFTTRGTIEGQIAYREEGENGFGYDPIFYVPAYGCTTAQMNAEQKNEISHRGKALRDMERILRRKAPWRES